MLGTVHSTPADEPFLFRLYASTRASELNEWGWDEATQLAFLSMQWKAQQLSYATQYPTADYRMIQLDGVRIGRMIVSRTEHEITLVDLSFLSEFCNKGFGTSFIRELQAEAADMGRPICLSVLKSSPAKTLYERLGFTPVNDYGLYTSMRWSAKEL